MAKLAELFAENLERIRQDRGWSKGELAQKAGIAQSAMSLYLNAKRDDVGLGTIDGIAENMGVDCWELIRPQKEKPTATFSDAARLLLAYETATPQIRDVVDTALAGVDVEAGLSRLRQLQQGSKLRKS